ncbi:diguanylate phosphodiesterase [Pseudomonas amygdali pv. tabaci str. ATCC 11528]|uniref:putative bifunctional diguanylate cyclase/phosphodiesterase n=2 Tax=Pseudomonas TaxID=286 RepID=UPI00062B6A8E|nr:MULTISPECIES: EAL domain-containing protein [Pseudomonas syringae group]KKY51263.1 diguanylate phosphodiesterase [Pseudomonas amygdali pv. tabaci str. ATCC 11528]MDU8630104.1 EAL domain-containing protein [Pseudomonas syringae group sp. 243L2]MDU8644965.1 EAL domain-containing protein [Pseudomonas syringae group sp. 26L6]QED84756.1 EAL domain-containing protein [Pseudomonas amygdali pv. tabaci str. ATCC 11528]
MSFIRSPHMVRKYLYTLLWFYLFSIFLVAIAWEFKLESFAMYAMNLPYDQDFEDAERWRFVLTSTGFALLSMVVPFILLKRLMQRLQDSYNDLLKSQALSDSLARHDPLSGLLNRRVFQEQLVARLEQASSQTAVFLIDLDKFKLINDTHGHAVGDAAICAVAESLREATAGWQASVARLGGDEFGLAVSGDFTQVELATLAESVLAKIAASSADLPRLALSATLGIAISPLDGSDADTLLQHADSAMYRGKNGGRAMFNFYEVSFEREQRQQELFAQELRQAIEHNQIQPFYQPIVNLPEQRLAGFELLARWLHPERGTIMPLDFIPVAEQLGLIKQLTESLLLQAFDQARDWPSDFTLSINVTSLMIESVDFPDWLAHVASEGQFPLTRLEVEVTENALVANIDSARLNLERLRAMGVSVALDDFGTGYSGLYHLTKLAIDKIKIDRSFFDTSLDNQNEMVKAILALGKSLRMKITAEGVEHEELADWLASHECDFAQGYLFGRPLPLAQVTALLAMAEPEVPIRARASAG